MAPRRPSRLAEPTSTAPGRCAPGRGGLASPTAVLAPVVVAVLGLLLAFPPPLAADPPELLGWSAARLARASGDASWLDGGLGPLPLGPDQSDDEEAFVTGRADVGVAWEASLHFGAHVHATARAEPGDGDPLGLVEAYVHASLYPRPADRLRFRLGQFFLPTSRENVQILWSSPYSLSVSAVNAWIGEEVRPLGLDAEYRFALEDDPFGPELVAGAAAFGGNDTAGALLAWRGWSLGDRLTGLGEVLPLPPLPGLEPGAGFSPQRDDGTRPFGEDLDGRVGVAAWMALEHPDRYRLQAAWWDNRGDEALHGEPGRQEYAWRTAFGQVGGELHLLDGRLSLVSEWLWGETAMGEAPLRVDADFEAVYLLASARTGPVRWTVRRDEFETVDRDRYGAPGGGPVPPGMDDNSSSGSAWTLAVLGDLGEAWRLGAEWVEVDAERPEAAAVAGRSPRRGERLDGRQVSLEIRWYF